MGVHIEDSLYTHTYQAFKDGQYNKVIDNAEISKTRFPDGANRDKFLFIGGLSKLNDGNIDSCLVDLKEVIDKYPNRPTQRDGRYDYQWCRCRQTPLRR